MRKQTVVQEAGHLPDLGSGGMPIMVDTVLKVERLRVGTQVRISHLKRNDRTCASTEWLQHELLGLERKIDNAVAAFVEQHSAFPWFSKIKGVGKENIAKIIGLVDITRAQHVSSLWKFAGYSVEAGRAPCRRQGEKLSYNATLRTMCYRLGSSLHKAGLRQQCSVCGELVGRSKIPDQEKPNGNGDVVDSEKLHLCEGAEFGTVAVYKYAAYYLDQKARYTARAIREGREIVPAAKLPSIKGEDGKRRKVEGDTHLSEGHLHNMALRKMIKLFLAHLWMVWREAEGLPVSEPYVQEKLGHTHIIGPWDMVDEE